jgi:membrane protein implicated in regulation of membrane protease activity
LTVLQQLFEGASHEVVYQGLFLALGLLLIVYAIVGARSLAQKNVSLVVEKLGLDLKADRATFLILLGMLAWAASLYVHGLRGALVSLQNDTAELRGQVAGLEKQLAARQLYDLKVQLEFPSAFDEKRWSIQTYLREADADAPQLQEWVKPQPDPVENKVVLVKVTRVSRDTTAFFVVRDALNPNRRAWKSPEIKPQETRLPIAVPQ